MAIEEECFFTQEASTTHSRVMDSGCLLSMLHILECITMMDGNNEKCLDEGRGTNSYVFENGECHVFL